MKNLFVVFFWFLISCSTLLGQDIYGQWKTIDDQTNMESSIIEIYEKDGRVYGRVVEILEDDKKDSICDLCPGEDKNQPVTISDKSLWVQGHPTTFSVVLY